MSSPFNGFNSVWVNSMDLILFKLNSLGSIPCGSIPCMWVQSSGFNAMVSNIAVYTHKKMNILWHPGRVVAGDVESDVICSIHCHKGVNFVNSLYKLNENFQDKLLNLPKRLHPWVLLKKIV